ncbi:MAG: hypothetical protein A2Y76_10105 [Planctomycetes bacterium RBG_13_60_9]|nr:MAG: hypothetical protein A2Y76_10105 [Planctomycetes bacterium RBG_13_60_9]
MDNVAFNWVVRIFSLAWLTGPIFDKEMRVSSRRRRNYVLRFVYIGLFTFFVGIMWLGYTVHGTSSVYQISRMAQAGQGVVMAVLWFQFLTTQAIAIVILSTSISDEIYKRTLGVLMTTPIGAFQIVIGKLMSKLLQVLLLLLISLPLLAIVRVFGGVPWNYLACGLCVTLTTVLFVGSLSLFFSIFTRRAYGAIVEAILATGLLFGLLPLLVGYLLSRFMSDARFVVGLAYVNPYFMMIVATESLAAARLGGLATWPVHCAIMLGASALLLVLAMVFVRKAALRQAVGQVAKRGLEAKDGKPASIHRVVGPPVLWKERRIPLLGKRKVATGIVGLVILGLLGVTYVLCVTEDALGDEQAHVMYTIVYFSVGILLTMIVPATCITSEKESQTWSLLLTTTVGTWEIIAGKALGVIRRCAPAWGLLFAHVIVFTLGRIIHPLAIVQLAILVTWVVLFLTGTGLYFSTRFKNTTTAVIANMALAAVLWAVAPLFLAIAMEIGRADSSLVEVYLDMNPFVQAVVVMMGTAGSGGLSPYEWAQGGMRGWAAATEWMVLTSVVYLAIGLVFVGRAGARLRRNPF